MKSNTKRVAPFMGAALSLGIALSLASPSSVARSYAVESDVVGEIALATTVGKDTIPDIARAYSQGYQEMRMANPQVDPWLAAEGTEIVVPSQYVLPTAPRDGIIVNVPEMRIYYFPRTKKGAKQTVATYPISIGRQDWSTPHGATTVVSKVKDPSWSPPESIRREHAANGDFLPKVVAPGPANPLGAYALRLGIKGYLIHGTDKPYGIGMRVTHGCMRLYPQDIEEVFRTVPVGTPVRLVNEPFKVGIVNEQVYLEVHPHLGEDNAKFAKPFSLVTQLISSRAGRYDIRLDWKALRTAVYRADGVPHAVGTATSHGAPGAAATL